MLKYLIEKEFRQFFRNSFLPRMVIVFPIVVLLIFPLAANFEVKNLNLAVVDADQSTYSSRLTRKTISSGHFKLAFVADDYAEALHSVERSKSDIVLEIPRGFERDIVQGEPVSVMISTDAVNGVKGGLGSSYLSAIVSDFASEIVTENPRTTGAAVSAVTIVPRYRFNPHLEYPIFMVPALMTMLLAMICGFLPALNIVLEKERGTMEQLNVTPVNRFALILAKLIPYWVIGFVVLTNGFIIARLVYSLSPAGSIFTIYLFGSVFVLAISGFGLVISNYAHTLQQAMFMMFFFVVTMILMSGLYTPVSSMPAWARAMSAFSPLRYVIEAMRMVYLKGSTPGDLLVQFAALVGFAVFFNGWAIAGYRKTT